MVLGMADEADTCRSRLQSAAPCCWRTLQPKDVVGPTVAVYEPGGTFANRMRLTVDVLVAVGAAFPEVSR
jgi:hypothetical protein